MRFTPFSFLLWLAFSPAGSAVAEDWPHWRGVRFDGKTTESLGPFTDLKVAWTGEVGIGFSSFAVVDGRVYTMGHRDGRDTVWCLDAASGRVIWRHSYTCELHPKYYEGGPSATPTVTPQAVFTLSKQGHAFAFEPQTGVVLWQRDLRIDHGLELPEWMFASSPHVTGELVVLNIGTSGLALDRRTGKTVWETGPDATGYSTPVPLPAEMGFTNGVAIFRGKSMSGIDVTDGRVLWDIPWKGLNATDAIMQGREILLSSIGGSAVLRLHEDGSTQEVWRRRDYQNYFNPPVKIDGFLYGFDGTTHRPTRFVCVEWATGRERWAEPGHATGGLILAGDLLVACDKGEILVVRPSPDALDVVWRDVVLSGTCWTTPVVAGGRIFARNARGTVVCLQPERP